MWNIEYEIDNEKVVVSLTLEDGFVVDNGRTKRGEQFDYLIYTATPGNTPSQPIIKTTSFRLAPNAKQLEIQLFEEANKRKIKKTQENVSDIKPQGK